MPRASQIDPATLPYHEPFLKFLREQKSAGRKIILATASDLQMAKPVADYVGLFDEVLGSDGKTNLRSGNKLKALVAKFGERGFDYAGNSSADLAVWRGAREAIVVNASRALVNQAADLHQARPDVYGKLFAAVPGKEFSQRTFHPQRLSRRHRRRASARRGVHQNRRRRLRVDCARAHARLRIRQKRRRQFPHRLRRRAFLLARVALLAAADARGRLSDSRLDRACPPISRFIPPSGSGCSPEKSAKAIGRGERSGRSRGAAVWVALEMIRARLFGGFPWNFLGASQYQMVPLIQIASVTGVYGVSFLVVWVSLSLYSAVRMIFRRPASRFVWQAEIFLPLTVVILLFAFSFAQLSGDNPPPASTLRVTLIQPSVPQTLIWDESENTNRFRQLLHFPKPL